MNLLETYSHYCGVKPTQPFIDEAFYPIPFAKYVVIHASAGMNTKMYDNFEEVACHIKIPVVQIGSKNDDLIPNALDLRGKTTWNHTAHIIHNAALFIGCDSICAHIASSFKIPSIVLWGATLPATCSTNWSDKTININPLDRLGCATACHANQCIRATKCINTIPVEKVLSHVSDFLGKENVLPVEILHIGPLYKTRIAEWVPINASDKTFNTLFPLDGIISLRADLCDCKMPEISNLANQTKLKFVILATPQQLKSLSIHLSKVEQLLILVDLDTIGEGIKALKEFTAKMYKTRLISKLPNETFNPYKLEMMDYPPISKLNDFEYNQSHIDAFVGKTLNIKTQRRVIGEDGRVYLTFNDALKNQNYVENAADNANILIEESHLKELQNLIIRKYAQYS
jgi:hypothetical protein